MNQSRGPTHALPLDTTAVLYRCTTTGQNVQVYTRTACLTTACTSRCGVPSAPESILSTEQAEPSCRPGPDSRSKKAPRRSGASVEDEDQCLNSRARRCRGQESCNHMPHDRVMALGGLPIAAGLLALRSDATRPGEPLAYLASERAARWVAGVD